MQYKQIYLPYFLVINTEHNSDIAQVYAFENKFINELEYDGLKGNDKIIEYS